MSLWTLFQLLLRYKQYVEQFIPVFEKLVNGEPVDVFITVGGRRMRVTVDTDDPA